MGHSSVLQKVLQSCDTKLKDNLETFGEWLREQRNKHRLTREEFANRVGCSVAMLRKIEDGERHPSLQIAGLIANVLDVPDSARATFLKVARGELSVDRLLPVSDLIQRPNIFSAQASSHNNLPVLPTPLIGRARELEELCKLLRDPQCRMLTLVGLGGIGKTRLAIETATQLENVFEHGAYFVPLAPVNSARFIVPIIADSIGFNYQGASPTDPKTQLLNYLREKHILLLVDNLEHLLNEEGVTELLVEIIQQARHIKLLITSRESLNLQGEWVFEVHGLPVPDNQDTEGTSVELFLQRTRRAHVGFTATSDDFPAILRICRLMDGIPLGLELAAAWVRTLSCAEIAEELERGLDILHNSARDLPVRHRSMRAVFDHSWKLLTEEEQMVLARLSVFRGGFRREATEQIAKATLATLSALVTRSLVRRGDDGRYHLHELIRQYAANQLANDPEEQTTTQTRHSDYYLTYFGNRDERLRGPAQSEALSELTFEMDNFRVAWDWAISRGQFALIEQALESFAKLYHVRSWFREGVDSLDLAINTLETNHRQSLPERTNQVALAHLLLVRSSLAFELAQYEQAQAMLERSLAILSPYDEPQILGPTIIALGSVMLVMGNYGSALELFDRGLEIATSYGNRMLIAAALTEKARLALLIDGAEKAYEPLWSAVAELRAVGEPSALAYGLILLSQSASELGRYDDAQFALEESVLLIKSVGDRTNLGLAYRGLGQVAQAQGKHPQAVEMFCKAVDIFTEMGNCSSAARGLVQMGHSFFALGDDVEARRVWSESLRVANETKGLFISLDALVGLAGLQEKQGNLAQSLEVLLIVLNHPASSQEAKKRGGDLRAKVEAQLTPTQIETIQAHAREKTFEAVVEEMLHSA